MRTILDSAICTYPNVLFVAFGASILASNVFHLAIVIRLKRDGVRMPWYSPGWRQFGIYRTYSDRASRNGWPRWPLYALYASQVALLVLFLLMLLRAMSR
jgi:hypothetical protein